MKRNSGRICIGCKQLSRNPYICKLGYKIIIAHAANGGFVPVANPKCDFDVN